MEGKPVMDDLGLGSICNGFRRDEPLNSLL